MEAASSLPSISRNLGDSKSNIGGGNPCASNSHSNHYMSHFNEVKSNANQSRGGDWASNYDSDEQKSLVNILHTSNVVGGPVTAQ